MSFSSETKNEMAAVTPEKRCCMLAEISGILRTCGKIRLEGLNKVSYVIMTENAAVARRVIRLMKEYFSIRLELQVEKNTGLKKTNVYSMTISEDMRCQEILRETGILRVRDGFNVFDYGIDESIIRRKCCKRAFLRGAFLGSGSITNPKKSYQMEIVVSNELLSANLIRLMGQLGLEASEFMRRESYVVYMKDSSMISDFLGITGGHTALFELENTKAEKEMKNLANRINNCDTANIDKTVAASEKHIQAIKKIMNTKGLDILPPKLREVALLRLEEPGASLTDLGQMLNPPLGKSGVNHRLAKVLEISEKIR